MRSQSSRRLLCVAAALAAVGCLSPTLPLPPPSEPTVEGPDAEGQYVLRGTAPRGSWVTAWNRSLARGWIQAANEGRYDLTIQAEAGDPIALWYQIDGKTSEPLEFEIPDPAPAP